MKDEGLSLTAIELLHADVKALRAEVRELRDDFQKAKGTWLFLKWLIAISVPISAIWVRLRHGGGYEH